MNLGKSYLLCSWKGIVFESVLIQTHAPAFCRRAEADVDASHIFLQGVLAAITLVAGAGDGGLEQGARCERSFLSAKWPSLCSTEGGILSQVAGVKALRVGLELAGFFFFFFPAFHTRNFAPESKEVLK